MTMYYDSKVTLIRFIASMVLIFFLGFAAHGLYNELFGYDYDLKPNTTITLNNTEFCNVIKFFNQTQFAPDCLKQ